MGAAGGGKDLSDHIAGEDDVSDAIHTDQLRSYDVIRKIPSLADVDHQQGISTARWNNATLQEH